MTAGVAKEEGGEEEEPPGVKILNRYEYDTWGNVTACEETVENRFRFNGQQYDPVTQQYYLRARFYNPVIGRFTQEDTYRRDGLNLYTYCRNNPVYYVDPNGHFCQNAADRINCLIDEGRIKGKNREKLMNYLQGQMDAGSITSWEQDIANKLGVSGSKDLEGGAYTDTIRWGVQDIEVRPEAGGYWGERAQQSNPRVDAFELKINPNNESFFLPHPDGGYVQFENMVNNIVQDGKLIMSDRSYYHVNDMPEFARSGVLAQAQRQLAAANAANYSVEWLVSNQRAVNQLTTLFRKQNVNIIVTYYPE